MFNETDENQGISIISIDLLNMTCVRPVTHNLEGDGVGITRDQDAVSLVSYTYVAHAVVVERTT